MVMAAAIGGAALVGGATSVISGNKAAKAQTTAATEAAAASERATNAQIEESRRQYDQDRADWSPYREVGTNALGKLAGMYGVAPAGSAAGAAGVGYVGDGGFTTSPGYDFRMSEGLKAIDRSSAARGILNSGGADKARLRYAQGVASSEYDTYAGRIAELAGVGQSATAATSQAGQNASGAVTSAYGANGQILANTALATGNARASAYQNTGNAINSTVNNLASIYAFGQAGGFKPIGYPQRSGSAYGVHGSDGIY